MMSQAINEEQKERSLHALNPMVLLALIVFLCFLASYIVPAGEYARILDPVIDKEIVDPASFSYVQQKPISFFFIIQSLTLKLQTKAKIIYIIIIIKSTYAI